MNILFVGRCHSPHNKPHCGPPMPVPPHCEPQPGKPVKPPPPCKPVTPPPCKPDSPPPDRPESPPCSGSDGSHSSRSGCSSRSSRSSNCSSGGRRICEGHSPSRCNCRHDPSMGPDDCSCRYHMLYRNERAHSPLSCPCKKDHCDKCRCHKSWICDMHGQHDWLKEDQQEYNEFVADADV